MSLEVIGAGFGRTGTLSLKLALEQLGFRPCYHMTEVFGHPGHSALWTRALKGELAALDEVLTGYRATVDWPGCHFWRELSERHPSAKVILTERDAQAWYKSISRTILDYMSRDADTQGWDPVRRAQWDMNQILLGQQTFGSRPTEEHVTAVYRIHNDAVKRAIPASRLLVYDVAQGWAPLCKFLRLPVPAQQFPKTNSTEEFRARASL